MSDGASQLSTHRADRAGSIRTLRTLRDTSPVSKIDGLFFLSSERPRRVAPASATRDGTPCDGRRIRVRGRPRGAEGIPPGKLGAKADQRRRPRRRADLGSNPQRGLVEAEHKVAASERAAQKGMRKRWDTEHAGVVVGPARAHPVEFSPGVDRMGRNPGTKDETRARESQAALRAFLEVAETEPELETPLVEDDQDRPE